MTSRFALLIHDLPELHLDLMLGREEVLWTWRLKRWPDPSVWIAAERISDHRTAYLDFEGPVSQDRGTVRRILHGCLDWLDGGSGLRVQAHYGGKAVAWELRPVSKVGEDVGGTVQDWQFRRLA